MKVTSLMKIVFCLVGALLLTACMSHTVSLEYQASPKIRLPKPATHKTITVAPANDTRADPLLLLHFTQTQYIGPGIPITHEFNFYSRRSLAEVVNNALETALEHTGYSVSDRDARVKLAMDLIKGKCHSIYHLVHDQMQCDLQVQIRVLNPANDHLVWKHVFSVSSIVTIKLFGFGFSHLKDAMRESVNGAINKLVKQVLSSSSFRSALRRA